MFLFLILFCNRAEINKTMTQAEALDGDDRLYGVERYAERLADAERPREPGDPDRVSKTVLALKSKFEHFRAGYYWYGVLLLCVRLLQTSLLEFFGSPGVQASFASIVALLTLGIQRELSPYLSPSDNIVSLLAQWCLYFWMKGLLLIRAKVLERLDQLDERSTCSAPGGCTLRVAYGATEGLGLSLDRRLDRLPAARVRRPATVAAHPFAEAWRGPRVCSLVRPPSQFGLGTLRIVSSLLLSARL